MLLAEADFIYISNDPETFLDFFFVKRAIEPELNLSYILSIYMGFQNAKEILYFSDKIRILKKQ